MDKSDLRIEQLQQYLDKKKGVVESDIKEYNQQLGKNYLHFFDWHADDLYKACYMDKNYNSSESSASTHICKLPSRYNLAYSKGSSTANEVSAHSDPYVVFKSFSASQQSMRSIYPALV